MRKIITITIIYITFFMLAACGGDDSSASSGGTSKLKLGHPFEKSHPLSIAAEKFADKVKEESDGSIEIVVYPNSELGGHNDLLDGLDLGSVDMTMVSTAAVGADYQPINLYYLPFLFENYEHAYKVADGEIGQEINEGLEKDSGLKTLAMLDGGFRTLTNSTHPIEEPSDLQDLKMRVGDTQMTKDTFQELGVNGTSIPLDELFTALQQKTVDGQDNPIGNVYTMKFQEVQPYITLSEHQWSAQMLLINADAFEDFSDEEQTIMEDAAEEVQDWEREEMQAVEQEYIEDMKAEGIDIIDLTSEQKEVFRDGMQGIWDTYQDDIGKDLIDKAEELGE